MTTRMSRWLLLVAAVCALTACGAPSGKAEPESMTAANEPAQSREGRLGARPRSGAGGRCAPGEHTLAIAGRRALMRVTAGGGPRGKALLLALHGAGSGGAGGGLYALRGGWSEAGLVLLAPEAEGSTWSFLRGADEDVAYIDAALRRAFARCRIDPRRVGVGGFSDGATYALTLGVRNGDLFRGVIALSPGGVLGENPVGRPRVFVAHGRQDSVLPIARTSDRIVEALRSSGYLVTYRKFRGGHEVVPAISRDAVRWFLRG